MIYLSDFTFPSEDKEMSYIYSIGRECYNTFYPFKTLSVRDLEKIEFESITILYGGNGSGKSTALNVMAEKTRISRDSIYNKSNFYSDYNDKIITRFYSLNIFCQFFFGIFLQKFTNFEI